MNDKESFGDSFRDFDSWLEDEIVRINQEHEKWTEIAKARHDESIENAIVVFKEILDELIEKFREADASDEEKRKSIAEAIAGYEKRCKEQAGWLQ